jgi:hypothetical protein
MRTLVFLLEGPSEKEALQAWLPHWLPGDVQARFIVFEGKQDMERQMVRKLRGWQQAHTTFIVLRDQDSADCHQVKAGLQARCTEAERTDAIVRIACHELESFFLGDWAAVAAAFHTPALARLDRSSTYREPDHIALPARELERHIPGYQKRDGARRIAPHMQLGHNRSRSLCHLRDAILRAAAAPASSRSAEP